jgi:dihydroorotate dehydrogenase electron transfer subunit
MTKRIEDFLIVENRRLNREYYVLVCSPTNNPLPDLEPGQFAEFRVDGNADVFLRRPISIYDVDYEGRTISFLIRILGKGTRHLSNLKAGDTLNMIYPLGNAFSKPKGKRPLLVGGGVGVAPLLFLGKWLRSEGYDPEFLLGFRNSELMVEPKEFERYGRVYITTDDGTAGEHGLVTEHSIWNRHDLEYSMVYTCGPDIMMRSVATLAGQRGMECEASLENTMACGFGACLCCTQATKSGNLMVCMHGPVFNTKELVW